MVKHFELNSEKLIDAIKNHEEIWNKYTKSYYRKEQKDAAWHSVGEELCENWDELDDNEKSNRLFMLKKRWNNIRDYYKKNLALQLNGSIGQPAMKRSKYMFSTKLDFMRPIFEKLLSNHKKENNSDDDQEEYMIVNYSSDSDDNTPLKPNTEESSPLKIKEETPPRRLFKIKTRSRSSNVESSSVAIEQAHTDSTDDESDLLFLKSLAPDMKALSRRQKIDFKLGILQLYKTLITQHDPLHENDDDDADKKFSIE